MTSTDIVPEVSTTDDRAFLRVLALIGIVSGVLLATDGIIDIWAADNPALAIVGVASPALGVLLVTGITLSLRHQVSCRHLEAGFIACVIGLIAATAAAFARNYVLIPLGDDLADQIAQSSPTKPALIFAGVLAVLGTVAFGTALIRHHYDPLGAWGFTILVPLAGFAALLPPLAAAPIAVGAGAAITRLAWVLYSKAR